MVSAFRLIAAAPLLHALSAMDTNTSNTDNPDSDQPRIVSTQPKQTPLPTFSPPPRPDEVQRAKHNLNFAPLKATRGVVETAEKIQNASTNDGDVTQELGERYYAASNAAGKYNPGPFLGATGGGGVLDLVAAVQDFSRTWRNHQKTAHVDEVAKAFEETNLNDYNWDALRVEKPMISRSETFTLSIPLTGEQEKTCFRKIKTVNHVQFTYAEIRDWLVSHDSLPNEGFPSSSRFRRRMPVLKFNYWFKQLLSEENHQDNKEELDAIKNAILEFCRAQKSKLNDNRRP